MRFILIMLITLLLITTLNAQPLTFGIVPQQSASKLIATWKPLIDYLERATGETITLKTEHSIPEFEKALYAGDYDMAYMNPYHYVVAHNRKGYTAKIRSEKVLVGILVGSAEQNMSDPSMTRGKRFFFPSPYAFAATLLIKYELLKQFNIDIERNEKFRYVNSHDSVYKGIICGRGDVGGGIERTFNNLGGKEEKEALKILHRTKPYPSHPIAFKSSVSRTTAAKIVKALLETPDNLLANLSINRLIETDDAEYEIIRDLARELSLPMH